jgi:acyl-CoA dehydrogenase
MNAKDGRSPRLAMPSNGDETMANDLINLALGEDYPELREAVLRLCTGFPGAYWQKLDEEHGYPKEFFDAVTEAGFLGALIPEEYGGSGLPLRAAAVILEEICASGCSAIVCHAQMYIMGTLLRHGNAEQKARYLPEIAKGKLRLQAFGVTEPSAGTDTTKITTRAERKDDHYIINGQKIWTSRAMHSDLMLLLARTTPRDQVAKKTDGLSVFLVDLRTARGNGVDIKPIQVMINTNVNEVFFKDLKVPAENLIGEEGKGFRYIMDGMNAERILVATECVGDGRWFLNKSTAYANERIVFDRPIGQNQGVQFPLARAWAELQAAELMCRAAAARFDADENCGKEANTAKLLASEAVWHAAEAAMQTHGGFGYAREYDIERKWRECRITQIAPLSTNLILSYIGQHVLGLPRSF